MKQGLQIVCGGNPPEHQAGPSSGEQGAEAHWRALRIMVADDDVDTVNTLAAILEDEGHRVERVYHGPDVLPAVRRFQPDAVLLDIAMPKMSGYDVAREIRRQFMAYRPLLIAISGTYVKGTDALLSRAVGFDHHMTKPVHPDEVLELLAPLIRSPGRD